MIKAVIFDFYGVICTDAYTAWQHKYVTDWQQRAAQFANISHRSDTGQLSGEEFYAELAQITGTTPAEIRQQLGASMAIDEAVIAIIKELRAGGIKIGLLSNSSRSLHDTLRNFGINDYFDAILTSDEAGELKPDARIFEQVTGMVGVAPNEAVFVDDVAMNAAGAEEAGLSGIYFQSPTQLRGELEGLGLHFG